MAGEVGRALGLPVPELVFMELDPALGAAEPDPEIQELIAASGGRNLGMDFLPGSLPFTTKRPPEPELAADVVWFDSLVLNVDRTPRNPNLLRWHGNLWLIDHGAALYVHHGGGDPVARAGERFPAIRDHVLLPFAGPIADADARLAPKLDRAKLEAIAAALPADWGAAEVYGGHLAARLDGDRALGGGGRSGPGAAMTRAEPFQYAMVRVIPRVERGEAFNAGVVLFCRPLRFLGARAGARRGAARRARARLRPRRGARAAGDARRRRRGAPGGRRRRGAAAVGALPLADRARQHDRAAVRGAHRADGRPRRGAGAAVPDAGGSANRTDPQARPVILVGMPLRRMCVGLAATVLLLGCGGGDGGAAVREKATSVPTATPNRPPRRPPPRPRRRGRPPGPAPVPRSATSASRST